MVWRGDSDCICYWVSSDINRARVRGGTAGGLEEGGNEGPRRGNLVEVGGGEVLEEDVVTKEVGEGRRREAAREV